MLLSPFIHCLHEINFDSPLQLVIFDQNIGEYNLFYSVD
mgnify:CR=1 FL=1